MTRSCTASARCWDGCPGTPGSASPISARCSRTSGCVRARSSLPSGLAACLAALCALYRDEPALFANDPDAGGFEWIDCADRENCVLSWQRCFAGRCIVGVLNLLPTPHDHYRVGVPGPGRWQVRLDTDDGRFGGSGYARSSAYEAEATPWHDRSWSLDLTLPPLSAIALSLEPS